jgi:hypothetical protein
MASWKINIICSPAMSAPSLTVTAIRLAVYTKKIGLPFMSVPSLAATAEGELDNENSWLACDVCALVGRVTAIWLAVCHFPGLKPVDCCLLAVFELI